MSVIRKPIFWIYAIIALISFINGAVYLSMRAIWFFINSTIGGNFPWAPVIFVLFAVSFVYSTALLIIYITRLQGQSRRPRMVNIIAPVLLVIVLSAIDAYLYSMLGSGQNMVLRNIASALPFIFVIAAIIFAVVFYPDIRITRSRIFRFITASVLVLIGILYYTDFGNVCITSGPYIQHADESNIEIVWTTNKKSTGFVEYGTDQNNLKRAYSSVNGIIEANSTVHKVRIPLEERLVYRVGSTKINGYFQNNVEYGNTDLSGFKVYSGCRQKDSISFYILSDIHENLNIYKYYLSKDDYDFVVLGGDFVNSVDNNDVIVDNVLKPISMYTDGTKPVYFVRGNHETRGAQLRSLPEYLSLPDGRYYYTFSFGPVYAIVLDSGEDKPDSHEEYSGLADFERYREEETKWLRTLSQSESYKNAKYRIAFVHIPLNSYDEQQGSSYLKEYQQEWRTILNGMGVDAVFSGHTHSPEAIMADNINFSFPTFIGGGECGNDDEYMAVKVEASDDAMKVSYINTDGKAAGEYMIEK